MTDKQLTEVIEGNKLIAEFMGMKHTKTVFDSAGYEQYNYTMPDELSKQVYGYTGAECFLDEQFSTSWDWLMPAVEKISKLPLLNHDNTPCTDLIDTCYPITFNMPDREQEGNVLFRFKGFSLHSEKTLIDAAWKAVVEVAEYHLNQNKKS